jgi:allantoinase
MPMHPRERLAYSPIEGRPLLKFPKGARLVIWPVLALEEWDMSRPMARMVISPPQGQPMLPDHPNWSWHEYGMRVGFWRLQKMMLKLGISPTVTLNARVCETYPTVVKACTDNGWELNAHGYDQVPMHKLDDQRAVIMRSMDVIEKFSGKRPRGWFGPGLTQTFDTLDYLSEAGVEYIGDWVLDSQARGRAALQFRDPRHRNDGFAASAVGSMAQSRPRPLQDSLRRVSRTTKSHGDGVSPLSLRCAAPYRPRRTDLR